MHIILGIAKVANCDKTTDAWCEAALYAFINYQESVKMKPYHEKQL